MSLAVFENFLIFAERAVAARGKLPAEIDAAELESALVGHGVVLLHSHMEQCLRAAVEKRCRRCTDLEILSLTLTVIDKEMGKLGLDSIKGTLKRFGEPCKAAFGSALKSAGLDDGSSGPWVSVMNQRSQVAHQGLPATCSLADLRLYYDDIRRILGFFCAALSLTAVEVSAVSPLIVLPELLRSCPE